MGLTLFVWCLCGLQTADNAQVDFGVPGPPVTPSRNPGIEVHGVLGAGGDWPITVSGNQIGRLQRDGIASECVNPKDCSILDYSLARAYDAYTFFNQSDDDRCVEVTLDVATTDGCNLQVNAYLDDYTPESICIGYLADSGSSSGIPPVPVAMSFMLPRGRHLVLVVHTVNPGEFGCDYMLTIDGGGLTSLAGQAVPALSTSGTLVMFLLIGLFAYGFMRRVANRVPA